MVWGRGESWEAAELRGTFPVGRAYAGGQIPDAFHRHCGTAVAKAAVPGTQGHAARNPERGLSMQNDDLDRTDLCRLADDGCPHAETRVHDLADLWSGPGKDDQPAR